MKSLKSLRHLPTILLFAIIPTLVIWAPFLLGSTHIVGVPIPSGGMSTVVSNYDGPLYIAVAKTLYNPEAIKNLYSFDLPTEYYAAHFPLYPLLMKTMASVVGYYPYAMLAVTVLSAILCLFFFYKFIGQYVTEEQSLFITAIFAVFPARWLIVRSIGSPEPLFLAALIGSVYFFQNKKYWMAGIWGAIAQGTKSPGILLFVAYVAILVLPALKHAAQTSTKNIFHKFPWRAYPIFLIPLTLLAVFALYRFTMGDFFAYFNSGDNHHLFFPPFQIFNYSQPWVGTFWLEEIIFIYLLGMLGIVSLYKKKMFVPLIFVLVFFSTTIFVSHRDLMRYSLPTVPFLFAGFSDILSTKEFRYILLFLLLPIYLFSLAYISQNHMQIADWGPLL